MNVLFLIQLPPPVHGASVVNKTILDSSVINTAFDTRYVNISPASEMTDLGKVSFKKMLATAKIYQLAIQAYLTFKPRLVYLTLSPHGAAFYKDGLLAVLLKILGAKLVFHMHGKGVTAESNKSRFKKAMYRAVFKGVDVIHLSESLFYDVEPIRDDSRELIAVPNSVSVPPEVRGKKDDGVITFLFLSNLMRIKGVDVLVKAASIIPEHLQAKFKIRIAGKSESQEYSEEIESLVARSLYNNIKIVGPKYNAEKYEEVFSADVFVLPTKNDCFPLTILEAMSSSLAVVSTNEGAIADIVEDGVTGVVLDDCTPEKLAHVMLDFINNPEKSAKYGAAGREEYLAKYTPRIFEVNLVSTLNKIIKKNEQRRAGTI